MAGKKIFVSLLALSLLFSLAVNVLLFHGLSRSFVKLQFSRIFPLGYISAFSSPKDGVVESQKGETVLFLGDSRAQMWDTADLKEHYQIINEAHGGQTSSQVLLQMISKGIPRSSWVVLQVGINDLHSLGAFPDRKDFIRDNVVNNISRIVEYIRSKGSKVIITSIFPPSEVPLIRTLFWADDIDKIIKDINRLLLNMHDGSGIFAVDTYKLLSSDDSLLKGEFADNDFFLHVNSSAYSVINKKIVNIMESGRQL